MWNIYLLEVIFLNPRVNMLIGILIDISWRTYTLLLTYTLKPQRGAIPPSMYPQLFTLVVVIILEKTW